MKLRRGVVNEYDLQNNADFERGSKVDVPFVPLRQHSLERDDDCRELLTQGARDIKHVAVLLPREH